MTARTRLFVLFITAPVIVFALVGGVLGKAWTREEAYRDLAVFEDVVSLISSNYVEDVDLSRVMRGAMRGLAEGLDPDSAYLTPDEVRRLEAGEKLPPAGIGVELTRQYYLRVIAARDGSPAARAGLRPGDYLRVINGKPTRELSVHEGMALLRGAPGTKVSLLVIRGNAAEPHPMELVREASAGPDVTGRMAGENVGYVRVASFGPTVEAVVAVSSFGRETWIFVCIRNPVRRSTPASASPRSDAPFVSQDGNEVFNHRVCRDLAFLPTFLQTGHTSLDRG